MKAFDIIRQREESDRDKLHAKYVKLITAMNFENATEAEAHSLADVLESLGITVERAEGDAKLVAEMREQMLMVDELPARAAAEAKASEVLAKAYADRQRVTLELNDAIRAAAAENDRAQLERASASAAKQRLSELEKSNPALFAAATAKAKAR